METVYFKFTDEGEAKEVLGDFFQPNEDGVFTTKKERSFNGETLYNQGIIYHPTGDVTVTDGIENPVMEASIGWHVNIYAHEANEDTYAALAGFVGLVREDKTTRGTIINSPKHGFGSTP